MTDGVRNTPRTAIETYSFLMDLTLGKRWGDLGSSPECELVSERFRKERNMPSLKKGSYIANWRECKIKPIIDTGNLSQGSSSVSSPASTIWKIREMTVDALPLESEM